MLYGVCLEGCGMCENNQNQYIMNVKREIQRFFQLLVAVFFLGAAIYTGEFVYLLMAVAFYFLSTLYRE